MVNLIKFFIFFFKADRYVLRMLITLMDGVNELIKDSLDKNEPRMRMIYVGDPDNRKTYTLWFGEYSGTPLERISELAMERNEWRVKCMLMEEKLRIMEEKHEQRTRDQT